MAEKRSFTAAGMLSLSLATATAPVHAADPAFCRQYARAAQVQVRAALTSEHCGAGLQGTRWSAEFAAHYEWCLGASPDATAAEREARTRYLRRCTDQ